MANLIKRLFSSALLVGFILYSLFSFSLAVFASVVTLFVAVALYEFYTMARSRGILVHRPLSIALGVILTWLAAWRVFMTADLGNVAPTTAMIIANGLWEAFWPATIMIIFIRQFSRENIFEALSGLATIIFGLAYIPTLLSYIFYIRAMDIHQGTYLVLFLLLVTKWGDGGAYFVGKFLGRNRLVPKISPRKTIEGLVGAVVFSGITAVLASPMLGRNISLPGVFILGSVLGIFGQVGDLAESLLKRDCQVKDTGSMIPGLGGVLDVIDSLIFTTPVFYWILTYILV